MKSSWPEFWILSKALVTSIIAAIFKKSMLVSLYVKFLAILTYPQPLKRRVTSIHCQCSCFQITLSVRPPVSMSLLLFNFSEPANASGTGCSLNIVFFSDFIKIFRTLFSLGISVCTHTRQVENQRCSRTGRVQKNHKILRKKHNF